METVDDDGRGACHMCLQCGEVADAGPVGPGFVVDDQHSAVRHDPDRFQDHVDTARVTHRLGRAGETDVVVRRPQRGGRAPHVDTDRQAGVGEMCCRHR
jgi:hypothetical protein